jgi:quaternary ammonium compound-resistance protein SugE
MAWLLVIAAGILEIIFATSLKALDGLTRMGYSVLCVVAGLASVILLSKALETLPVGTGYAVWVGIGAVGVALAGIVILGESASLARLALIGTIVVCIAGLKFVES